MPPRRVERWEDDIGVVPHPRPQFSRSKWLSLDGRWECAFSPTTRPGDVVWSGAIEVPFAPESPLSGIHDSGFHPAIWYRRSVSVPEAWADARIVLHFGAVDYAARVFLNGALVATHEGGHTPFSADITDALVPGEQELVVRAEDDPRDVTLPRGKQDWRVEPHAIWYPRTTGIWQTVWLEPVPATRLVSVRMVPDLEAFAIHVEAELCGDLQDLALEAAVRLRDEDLARATWHVPGTSHRGPRLNGTLHFPAPPMDDLADILWSPEHPNLLDVTFTLRRRAEVVDTVESYTALRSVRAEAGTFLLNERPYKLRMALDQGYWDDGLLTAPSDEALRRDVELARALGFNGVRKHQKIEQPRYLYWADRLGLLVWEEMPSAYAYGPRSVGRITREWLEVLERDANHPCIVAWVCFNESWGVPQLATSAQQRHAVAALYHLTRSLDGTRLVIGNDGWEHVSTDLLTMHDYARDPGVLRRRYATPDAARASAFSRLDHGRLTTLPGAALDTPPARDGVHVADEAQDLAGRPLPPLLLSEFGGVRFHPGSEGWGYQEATDSETFLSLYRDLIAAASSEGLAGFCYTQFADTFQEQNGLLFSDRRPKAPLEALAAATRGGR